MQYDFVATITGVSGFVGSHLARALLNDPDHKIRVFGVDVAKSHRIDDLFEHGDDFRFYDYDVHQPLRSDLLACDTFYHFAGIADPQRYIEDPITVMDLNLMGLRNVLERMVFWSGHRPRIIYSSTSEVYGRNDKVPFTEDESDLVFGPVNMSRWCYAMSKAVGEHYLQAFTKKYGFQHTIFRFFNFVGEDIDAPGAGRVITKMVGDAMNSGQIIVTKPGTQTRCFTWAEDFVVPLVRACTWKNKMPYGADNWTMNLGSNQEVRMLTLAEKVWKLLNDDHGIHCGLTTRSGTDIYGEGYQDVKRRVPDITRAKEILEWEATTPLQVFLPRIVDATVKKLKASNPSSGYEDFD